MAVGDPGKGEAGAQSPLSSYGDTAKGEFGETYDARTSVGSQKALQAKAAKQAAAPRAGLQALKAELGVEGVVETDPLTGTFRQVSKLDGFLTSASKAAPESVALSFLSDHSTALGLSAQDISGLSLRKAYIDSEGTAHLSFVQSVNGVPVFGNGFKAHVAKDGRLISIDGSPASALPTGFGLSKIDAVGARAKAIADVKGDAGASAVAKSGGADQQTTFANGDHAQQVVFLTVGGPRLAWQTIVAPSKGEQFIHVVDAESGQTLYRRSLVEHEADPEATGNVWDYFPGSLRGGDSHKANLSGLSKDAANLNGLYAHVYADLDNNNAASPDEEIAPNGPGGNFEYGFQNFIKADGAPCSSHYQCSWNPNVAGSWKTNMNQTGVQLYYFLGKFHDHLEAGPIGFTRAAGNFDARDGDSVKGEAIDGANSSNGMPGANSNNANMSTPPDGMSPRMQMYLFFDDGNFPWLSANSGDSADIVYHEYTHGLSNRLVVDAMGNSTLSGQQARSMGEAWSDWYALDFLTNEGFQSDRKNAADELVGDYVGHGIDGIRSQRIDCKVGSVDPACHGTAAAGTGGYTYGDFGKISARGPEVHADGEIWVETLWDLRCELGSNVTESLVTRAMELSPSNPSFLDERNAILLADSVVFGGAYHAKIWSVFANRGMGFFAASNTGADVFPAEDFSVPPPAGTPTYSVSGKVTNAASGEPVVGAVISFAGHPAAAGGSLTAVTDANGDYWVDGLYAGNYPKFNANGPGYEGASTTLVLPVGGATANFALVRNWASEAGGSKVTDFNGVDFDSDGCGARAMLDQSQGTGWSTDAVWTGGSMASRFAVIKLPNAVNISDLKINPTATCGDPGSASTGHYSVETSADGVTWALANDATFTAAHRNKMNSVPLAAGTASAVRYIRYTMLTSQAPVCPGPYGGCQFVDTVELAVYGTAS
ncbi:M36 family metallopeptidase [Longispora sp. K20-0274]|uniref:M36 family metallopeptidase n=1 Tax=Longispora sp. K20-0274 TaxID=3088255 RepID=UPI00399B7DF2